MTLWRERVYDEERCNVTLNTYPKHPTFMILKSCHLVPESSVSKRTWAEKTSECGEEGWNDDDHK